MLIGFTHAVSPNIPSCEITFIDRAQINYELAVRQHDEYCAVLKKCGVVVKRLSANLSYPDSCFVEDTAIVLDELAIVTSMGTASRRGETAAIEAELSKYREIAQIQLPAMIEGGDVLQVGRKLFVGLSSRTNAQGIKELSRITEPLGYSLSPVNIKSSLHFKTACSAINDETLLVNPNWIDLEPFKGFNVLFTPDDESWAANTLRISDITCLQAGFPKTVELVERLHHRIEILDISEFRKAEAGISCLSIILQDATAL